MPLPWAGRVCRRSSRWDDFATRAPMSGGVGLFLTFTAAMDRARDADRLWANSARLFDDEPWVFDPAEIDGVDDTDRRRASRTQGEPATLR